MWEAALTSSKEDETIQLWEMRSGTLLASFTDNKSDINLGSICTAGPDFFLATQQNRPAIQIYSWVQDNPVLTCSLPEKVGPVCATHDGLYCVAGGYSGACYIWELSTGALMRMWNAHYSKVSALSVTQDDAHLLTGGEDGMVHVWAIASILDSYHQYKAGESAQINPVHTFSNHTLPITSLICGTANSRVYSTSLDRSIKVFDLPSKQLLGQVILPTYATSGAVNPTETALFVGGGDGTIYQIDLVDLGSTTASAPAPTKLFKAHTRPVHAVSVNFDGTLLLSSSGDGSCIVWDIYSRQAVKNYTSHKGAVGNAQIILNPLLNEKNEKRVIPQPKPLSKFLTKVARDPLTKISPMVSVDLSGNARFENYKIALQREEDATQNTLAQYRTSAETWQELRGQLNAEIHKLKEENERWKTVNNKLYGLCVEEMINKPTEGQEDAENAEEAEAAGLGKTEEETKLSKRQKREKEDREKRKRLRAEIERDKHEAEKEKIRQEDERKRLKAEKQKLKQKDKQDKRRMKKGKGMGHLRLARIKQANLG